MRRSRQEM